MTCAPRAASLLPRYITLFVRYHAKPLCTVQFAVEIVRMSLYPIIRNFQAATPVLL
jgi:hypothetical protein